MQRFCRIIILAGLVTCGVLAVLVLRVYNPLSTTDIILVPEAQYEANSNAAVDQQYNVIVGENKKSADLIQHHEPSDTEMRETDDKLELHQTETFAPVISHNNDINAPPQRTVTTTGPPLQRQHNERQQAIVDMFKHAWDGYTRYAWGKDELYPVTKTGSSSFGMGLTIIDSLDTMWLMGLTEDYHRARDWVANNLNFAKVQRKVSVFETNIRVLGGLLAIYHLSNDDMFLQKAVQLGDRLLPAFQSPSGIPYGSIILNGGKPSSSSRVACVAEIGTLQLEFRDLSHSTGDSKYQEKVDKALNVVQSHFSRTGIATQEVYIDSGAPKSSLLTVGGRTDSYYEYLIKQWIQSGKKEDKMRDWYSKSADAIVSKFVKYSQPHHWAFLAKLYATDGVRFSSGMDHLACFIPGMLALGYLHGFPEAHLTAAKNLTHTCYEMYHQSPSGLSPEEVTFNINKNSQTDFHTSGSYNLLRPETVESLFLLYRVTKDPMYREWGWEITQAFQRHSKVDTGGYTTVRNVNNPTPTKQNKMESFFLAETLKYLFLLFTDDEDILPLDKWVFNTEAHPLPVWTT